MFGGLENLSRYYELQGLGFRAERVYPLEEGPFPDYEILLTHPRAEDFFGHVRCNGWSYEVDKFLFEKALGNLARAVRDTKKQDRSFTFNIDLITALTPGFGKWAADLCAKHSIPVSNVHFEITEQTPLFPEANLQVLEQFTTEGFGNPIIDDVHHLVRESLSRACALKKAADGKILKLDHMATNSIRDGEICGHSLRKTFGNSVVILAEGVRSGDFKTGFVGKLREFGVSAVQVFNPNAKRLALACALA